MLYIKKLFCPVNINHIKDYIFEKPNVSLSISTIYTIVKQKSTCQLLLQSSNLRSSSFIVDQTVSRFLAVYVTYFSILVKLTDF